MQFANELHKLGLYCALVQVPIGRNGGYKGVEGVMDVIDMIAYKSEGEYTEEYVEVSSPPLVHLTPPETPRT